MFEHLSDWSGVVMLTLLGSLAFIGWSSHVRSTVTDDGNELPFGAAYAVVGHDGTAFVSGDGYILQVNDNDPDRRTREFDDIKRFDARDFARWANAHSYEPRRIELHMIGFWFVDSVGGGVHYEPPMDTYRQEVIHGD